MLAPFSRSVLLAERNCRPTTFVWQLDSIGAPGEALRIEHLLELAERTHKALVRLAGRGDAVICPELTGQSAFNQPLRGPHRHAHVMPLDIDEDGWLDHILLHAPMGFGDLACTAIENLKSIFGPRGQTICNLRLRSLGNLKSQFQVAVDGVLETCEQPRSTMDGARVWQSLTPFVPPRYLKKSGANTLCGQVQAELRARHFPEAVAVIELPLATAAMRRCHRIRRGEAARPPQNVGFALQLEFAEPVSGPICLGYASHFGMGLFEARESTIRQRD